MVGFLVGANQEAQTGDTLLYQLTHPTPQALLFIALIIYGSMVPVLKDAKLEAFGPFSPRAEIANGRAAMIAFAVLLALEWKAGVPFF